MGKKLEKADKKVIDKKEPHKYKGVQKRSLGEKSFMDTLSVGQGDDAQHDERNKGIVGYGGVLDGTEKGLGIQNSQNDVPSEAMPIPEIKSESGTTHNSNAIPHTGPVSLNTVTRTINKKDRSPIQLQHNENDDEEKRQSTMYREYSHIMKREGRPLEKKSEGDTQDDVENDVWESESWDDMGMVNPKIGNTPGKENQKSDYIHKKSRPKSYDTRQKDKKGVGESRQTIHREGENANKTVFGGSHEKHMNTDGERADSYFIKEKKQGSGRALVQKIEKAQNAMGVLEHELTATYDTEERKKSAAKDFIVGKAKGRVQGMAVNASKKLGKTALTVTKRVAAQIIKWLFSVIAPFLPVLLLVIAMTSLITVIIAGLFLNEQQQQVGGGGNFGKMYYWIEYETGKTDDSAFATVLGDGGRAFGIQFDYMYALQPLMRYCHGKNPIAYAPFQPFLEVDKSTLLGSQALADAWLQVFEGNKDEFIEDQKQFAKMNYYDGIEERAEQYGVKLKTRDDVCKGAVLSYSFQCGGSSAFSAVVELSGVEDDEEFLKKIYEIRTERYPTFSDRYEREYSTALALIRGQGTGEFVCPVDMTQCMVTSEFGEYRSPSDPAHKGTDFASYGGLNVPTHAIADGTVTIAGYSPSAGNWVVIDHGNGIVSKYMHHESICVAVGQKVKKGEQIGNMGTTGDSTGVHLHLQIEVDGVPVNARNYINF